MSTLEHIDDPQGYTDTLTAQDPIEGAWLRDQVDAFWARVEPHEYEFVDNTRIASCVKDPELDAYDDLRCGGCCGFMDVDFGPSPRGITYKYGFNHGH